MAKRISSIEKFGPAKKAKLDVSINCGKIKTTTNIVDFWTSDDDDYVLLAATQMAEERQQTDVIRNTEDALNFTDFSAHANGTTSTQELFVNDFLTPAIPTNSNVEEIFGTDETFVFLSDNQVDLNFTSEEKNKCKNAEQATANRRQLAQERQLKFLMDRVDLLKKENSKLQRDLIDCNHQAATKDGEASLLRNELQVTRKHLQDYKMDKIITTEEVEKNYNKTLSELLKKVEIKNMVTDFTNVEISSRRVQNVSSVGQNNQMLTAKIDENRKLLRIENLVINGSSYSAAIKIKDHVYKNMKDTREQWKKRSFFEVELENLFFYYAQLKSDPYSIETITSRINISVCKVFTEFYLYTQSLEVPENCILYPYKHFDLRSDSNTSMRCSLIQSSSLYSMEQAVHLRRYIGTLALICQEHIRIPEVLLQQKCGKNLIIQIIIEAVCNLSYSLEVEEHFGVLEATASFLHSLIRHADIENKNTGMSQYELQFNLLKQLVFTRPSPWIFRELSACILLCAQKSQFMAKMCINSSSHNFVSDRVRSFYRFGPRSCLIQVYAGLLELCFCCDLPLQPSHFKLLLSICENHVRFVYKCFSSTPEFILKMLSFPSFTDDEKEGNANILSKVVALQSDITLKNNSPEVIHCSNLSTRSVSRIASISGSTQDIHENNCECYVKLCLSVVTIVFQMTHQWILQNNKSDVSQISEISQIAIQLFTLIFREYYLTCLFRDSEEITKHHLFLLCKWWRQNSQLLNFNRMQERLLYQLQDLQFMVKPLYREINCSNPCNDIAEWKRLVNNTDESISKFVYSDVQFNFQNLSFCTKDFFGVLKHIICSFD